MIKPKTKQHALLLLEDGTCFEGYGVGANGTASGEICFNTGTTGYQEIMTDPSYKGQIVAMTNVHIGNYGIKNTENQSQNLQISGLICRNFPEDFSRFQADQSLQNYLSNANLVAVSHIDTRRLVQHIRANGAMNSTISTQILDKTELMHTLQKIPNMEGLEMASLVSTPSFYAVGNPKSTFKVAVMDYGIKQNTLQCLIERGCFVGVFPHNTSFETLKTFEPHGVLLSNGPGDPATMKQEIEVIKQLLGDNIPIFGICLGNQLLGLACGCTTKKMKYGHRGINQPVKNLDTGLCEITSQNHGFGIDDDSLKNNLDLVATHINLNDHTIEGIKHRHKPAFAVQYHPEGSPGTHDSRYLFDKFVAMLH